MTWKCKHGNEIDCGQCRKETNHVTRQLAKTTEHFLNMDTMNSTQAMRDAAQRDVRHAIDDYKATIKLCTAA